MSHVKCNLLGGKNTGSAPTYTVSVPKGCKEGIGVGRKQALNVCETFDLELLRLLLNDFSDEGKTESVGLLLGKQLSVIPEQMRVESSELKCCA